MDLEIFNKHPSLVHKLDYLQHLQQTLKISLLCLICFLLFFIHAFFGMFFSELADDLLTMTYITNDTIRFKNSEYISLKNGIVSKEQV